MIAPASLKLIRMLNGMTTFMSQNLHAVFAGTAFDFEDLSLFQAHQSRVREVEGNGDTRYAFRGEPVVR